MRLAIIGVTGHVEYAMRTLQMRKELELVCVAPGNAEENVPAFMEAAAKRGYCPRAYDSWREMLDREKVDVVSIAPWFCYAADISMECLKRGIHVYSEKPLATTLDKLDELTEVWEKSGCSLDGMFGLRHTPWFLAVRKAVEAGEIGQVRQIHGQKSYKMGRRSPLYYKQALYGGILPWVGIHAMDWVTQIGGSCRWVQGMHSRQENRGHGELEVSSAALMELENGVIATVTADFFRPDGSARHDDDRLRVTGTKGMIEAYDGRVYLENEQPKRELVLPEAPAPMAEFLDSIGTERAKELARMALGVTRAAIMARESADFRRRDKKCSPLEGMGRGEQDWTHGCGEDGALPAARRFS